jgi:hypothetical protein
LLLLQAVLDGLVSSCAQRADTIWSRLFIAPIQSGFSGVAESIDRCGEAPCASAPLCICYASSADGINAMITALYFCWRADLVSQSADAWTSATDEYSDMDGPTRLRDQLCPRHAGCISCWRLVL